MLIYTQISIQNQKNPMNNRKIGVNDLPDSARITLFGLPSLIDTNTEKDFPLNVNDFRVSS